MDSHPSPLDPPRATVAPRPPSPPEGELTGELLVEISRGMVRMLREHTGDGSTVRANTTVSAGLVMVTLMSGGTASGAPWAGRPAAERLVRTRAALHHGIRSRAIALVQELTEREVIAYLPDQQLDPELQVVFFLLAPSR